MASINEVDAKTVRVGIFGREARVQYGAMARLHWRMFVNGLRSINGLFDLGATGVAWTLYSVLGMGMGLGLCGAAHAMAAHASWQFLPILFWVTTFLWLMFPMMVASFQEQPESRTLLRFPVCFGSYFLLHLIAGLMEASTIVGGLCCLGIWVGIFIARPDLCWWTALTLLLFGIFNILLVRAVFAWIDRWLAQRKTREILGAAFMVLFVCLLVINSVWNQKRHVSQPRATAPFGDAMDRYAALVGPAKKIEQWMPPGLGSRTIQQGVERKTEATIASLGMLGGWTLIAGGVLAGRLKGEFRGQNLSWAPSRSRTTRRDSGWTWGGTVPFVAILEKEVRTLSRTLPLLWALIVPALIIPVVAGAFHHGASENSFPYAFPLCVAYALLGFTGLFYNSLGVEGAGIQLLFLSPTPIRTVLLAKNLLHSVLFVMVGFVAGALSCIRLGVPPFVVLAGTGAWLVFALPCNLAAGIVFSLAVPYRINPGRITRPAGAQANSLPATLIQMAILAVGALIFWLCWSLKEPWLPIPIFLTSGMVASFAWVRILRHSDENANQRRDLLIATLMRAE